MGSATSKLKKKLSRGDETSALALFDTNKDLRKKFDPNASYGDRYNHDTPLHMASRHAMRRALRQFLFDYSGNPNKKNSRDETSLHCACQLRNIYNTAKTISAHEECINMLVEWKGSRLGDEGYEKLDLAAQDKLGNTALHYAAQSGLMSCVKQLVELDAPLFTENDARQTPCEMAEKASKPDIAQYLESKMVFYENEEPGQTDAAGDAGAEVVAGVREEYYQGLRPQELQEAKDSLIVETSDMLRVPLFTAEVLLRQHEWSREVLLESWIVDPVSCCEKSGVRPPENLDDITHADHELNILKASTSQRGFEPTTCEICFDDIVNSEESVPMVCEHCFCQSCWQDYLNIKIKEGDAHNIVCPAFNCSILVPVEFIETAVSSKMANRYLQFDIKAFVASNPRLVWCPYPGCGLAIQNPERNRSASVTSRTSEHSKTAQYQSLTAHCSSGHAFCWLCQMEPHDPASCDDYKSWIEKIAQMKKDEFEDVTTKSETAANIFWLLSNSKNCPNCKTPIEKNEGCNHMRCSKCKHDFCWVCLEPWKCHNSTTGGFFRCTRYEVVDKVDERHQNEMTDASEKHKNLQELNRFLHYYTRYENHKRSLQLEEPLLDKAKQKMSQLASAYIHLQKLSTPRAAATSRAGSTGTLAAARFIQEAVSVLIRARHLLQFCYVFGYYLQDVGIKRMVFELLQTELEEKTECLSEIVARPYLRTPKAQIIKITKQVSEKTEEFFNSIANGLLPQDISQIDDKAHTSRSPKSGKTAAGGAAWLTDSDDSGDDQLTKRGICKAAGCNKLKLQHSGTPDQHHDYCSLACLKTDYVSKRKAKQQGRNQQIDLLQALEMSRLQLLQDMDSLTTGSSSDASGDEEAVNLRKRLGINATELPPDPILEHVLRLSQSVYTEEEDEDLTLAIAMSMQNEEVQREMLRERSEYRKHRAHSHSESLTEGADGGRTALDEGASSSSNVATGLEQDEHPSGREVSLGDDPARVLYNARLVELDNAIDELLNVAPTSLRRTESDRRRAGPIAAGESPPVGSASSRQQVRRTRSERKCVRRSRTNHPSY